MIVFGHNSFLLHACKPSQLGMPVEIDQQYRVERRQRYAHLFWIPTFGIGKVWVLRDLKTDQLYEPNAMVLQALKSLPLKESTPWYTFALPILALAIAILAPIYMKVDEYLSDKRYEARQLETNESIKSAIESPGKYQYLELQDESYQSSFIKIVGSDKDSVRCLIVTGDYRAPGFLQAFARNKGVLDTIVLSKSALIKSIGQNNPNAFLGLPDERSRELVGLHEYSAAVFEDLAVGFEEGKFIASLQNEGADVIFEKATVTSGNLALNALPEKISSGDEFQLTGTYDGMEPKYNAVWSFKNAEGESFLYDVYISSARIYFNKR